VDGRAQPNLRAIGADRAWANGITGPGVTVGIADTGVDGNHPALRGAFRGADAGWYDPARGSTFPTDPDGPGTQLAGAALGSNGIGVAPGARWIGCAEPPVNLADPATYLGCLQFMLAPFPLGGDPMRDGRPDLSADILLGAWGCPQPSACDTETMEPAVRALSAAGIFMVSAGGTAGGRCGLFGPPQLRYPQVLTVGTYPPGGPVADIPLSAVGRPDVVAPGTDVVSAVPGGGYGRISGPPVAAAEVAGIVALLWAASPGLVGNLVRTRELLLDTATPVPEGLGCFNRAAPPGRLVNADEAVRAARLD
jgi:subtilisin family serine protease